MFVCRFNVYWCWCFSLAVFTLELAYQGVIINHNTLLCYHAQGVFSYIELVQLLLISHNDCVNSSRLQLIVSCT